MKNFLIVMACAFLTSKAYSKKIDFPIDRYNEPSSLIWKLLGSENIMNAREIFENNIMSGEVESQPWAAHYWPYAHGALVARHGDPGFNNLLRTVNSEQAFPSIKKYHEDFPSASVSSTHYLSPAEKYDLWIGDENFTLTKSMLEDTSRMYDQFKKIPSWFGLCHGAAPASIMLDRPKKFVQVKSPKGHNITFFPSDIKALATLAWTKKHYRTAGRRCNSSEPDSLSCKDLNPATLHLGLVNQIGRNQRSFILDISKNEEVWNHALASYRMKYFNLRDRVSYNTFSENVTPSSLNPLRAAGTKKLIGVEVTVSYVGTGYTLFRQTDDKKFDPLKTKNYFYDLELDSNDKILGGEWLSSDHPDFAWLPSQSEMVATGETPNMPILNSMGQVRSELLTMASGGIVKGAKYGGYSNYLLPMPSLVKYLIKQAQ